MGTHVNQPVPWDYTKQKTLPMFKMRLESFPWSRVRIITTTTTTVSIIIVSIIIVSIIIVSIIIIIIVIIGAMCFFRRKACHETV
jgi:hypothetical protein